MGCPGCPTLTEEKIFLSHLPKAQREVDIWAMVKPFQSRNSSFDFSYLEFGSVNKNFTKV